jgi:Fic family protein
VTQTTLNFDGPALTPADHARLTNQQALIVAFMRSGEWRTLREIAEFTGAPEASASAQLRHLRKPRFGSHTVERRHEGGGVYSYRVIFKGD